MPYKDKSKASEASKERMRRHRQGVTSQGVTSGVTLLKRPNGEDYDPNEMLGNRNRYMVLSDGQVLDRKSLPYVVDIPPAKVKETRIYPAIAYALTDIKTRAKLRKICQSLKNHDVLKDVRYGVSGPTFGTVAEMLAVL